MKHERGLGREKKEKEAKHKFAQTIRDTDTNFYFLFLFSWGYYQWMKWEVGGIGLSWRELKIITKNFKQIGKNSPSPSFMIF